MSLCADHAQIIYSCAFRTMFLGVVAIIVNPDAAARTAAAGTARLLAAWSDGATAALSG
jgi:hypothetical protein